MNWPHAEQPMVVKEFAKQVIDQLPDEASMQEIIYALYVRDQFQRGERQIREGHGIDHDRVKLELAQ